MREGPHFSSPQAAPLIYRAQAGYYFSHRTDPKPRPEGYRDHKLSQINPAWVEAGWDQGQPGIPSLAAVLSEKFTEQDRVELEEAVKNAQLSAVEALEASQTGEVPHEPSKGHGDAMEAQETASLKQP